ncbi:hypothetical protein LMG9964_06606 [Paraburkholderia phenoliruptrix]|uniref:Transposase n=3 Tax=Paraburkholderia TaxID=1822464 RepID=A0A1H7EED6_9BURK|nr:Integrase, catalytic region [Paraburkholderia phenoliruptrix BR3459a]CAB4052915.1 hypothetical protein LMG9964_06606 [Paraburkholderia phenoliruptrix]SEK11427.1 hypothetical protein SAMN05192539_10523 [Paraburkholderia diazotrophica]
MLIDALRQTYAIPALFAVLGLARSSYFYHRARLLVADKYAGVRLTITEIVNNGHHFCQRSSSACAKYAGALRRIFDLPQFHDLPLHILDAPLVRLKLSKSTCNLLPALA